MSLRDGWSKPDNETTQIIRPGGSLQEILPCGHDVSNRDRTVESGTELCRLCDLQSRCRDAESQEKEFRERYEGACKLVAEMHAAAVGEVRGPRVGPVEDVAEIREGLRDANDLCRSAFSIAQRDGKATNWEAFRAKLSESLERQHKLLFPVPPPYEFSK